MAVESPGAAAMVFAPHDQTAARRPDATVAALRVLVGAAWSSGLRLLELLLGPGSSGLRRTLVPAGFRYLTELVYLTCEVDSAWATPRPARDLTWVSYTPEHEDLFAAALEAAYLQSLDCPEPYRRAVDRGDAGRSSGP